MATANKDSCTKHSEAATKWRDKQVPYLFCFFIKSAFIIYIMSVCTSVLVLDEASAFFLTWSHMTRSFRKVVLTKLFLAGELKLSWPSEELKHVQAHIPSRENPYLNFSSKIFPGSKLIKSDKNMKISQCKSSCTSYFVSNKKLMLIEPFLYPLK